MQLTRATNNVITVRGSDGSIVFSIVAKFPFCLFVCFSAITITYEPFITFYINMISTTSKALLNFKAMSTVKDPSVFVYDTAATRG